jgi:hypothetical protein
MGAALTRRFGLRVTWASRGRVVAVAHGGNLVVPCVVVQRKLSEARPRTGACCWAGGGCLRARVAARLACRGNVREPDMHARQSSAPLCGGCESKEYADADDHYGYGQARHSTRACSVRKVMADPCLVEDKPHASRFLRIQYLIRKIQCLLLSKCLHNVCLELPRHQHDQPCITACCGLFTHAAVTNRVGMPSGALPSPLAASVQWPGLMLFHLPPAAAAAIAAIIINTTFTSQPSPYTSTGLARSSKRHLGALSSYSPYKKANL